MHNVAILQTEVERAGRAPRPLSIRDLGLIDYLVAWDVQKDLAARLGTGDGEESLLLLEHPHTYTCGRRGGRDHILVSEEELEAHGVSVLDVDRGGDITYHGPGQLVAYPIVNLMTPAGVDYHAYIRRLEAVLIDLLADYGIDAFRFPGYTGVWVGPEGHEEKVAAIGVKVDGRGVSTHGIALNVSTDLSYFARIVPCGIAEKGVTSLDRLMASHPSMSQVKVDFAGQFRRQFGFD